MSRVRGQLSEPPIESLTAFEIKTICELKYAGKAEDSSVSENESNDNNLNKISDEALKFNEEEESNETALNPEGDENEDGSVSENTENDDEIGLHNSASHRMSFVNHKKNDSLFVFEGKNDFLILGVFFLLIAFFLIGGFYLNSN